MNLKYHRIAFDGKEYIIDDSGQNKLTQTFLNIKKFNSVGLSIIYMATANFDMPNEIKKGDIVYFKANNTRGISHVGRTSESSGSCEDVAEVFCYYLLKNYTAELKDNAILKPTPYNFAEYENDTFRQLIEKQTNYLIKSNRLYGCISKNVVDENGIIIHGSDLLSLILDPYYATKSDNNNLVTYEKALQKFKENAKEHKQEILIHPGISRYNANMLFFDYFVANSDRHWKNVNFQQVLLENGVSVVVPLAIIDNGGAFALQSHNCEQMFESQGVVLEKQGRFENTETVDKYNPFDCQYGFNVGRDCFKNSNIANIYDELSYVQRLVFLISQNRNLFNDFKHMYTMFDYDKALDDMIKQNKYPEGYLPNFRKVIKAELSYKKEEISKVMAQMLGIEFDEKLFHEDPNFYINQFEQLVLEDELTIKIASNQEIKSFENYIEELAIQAKKD